MSKGVASKVISHGWGQNTTVSLFPTINVLVDYLTVWLPASSILALNRVDRRWRSACSRLRRSGIFGKRVLTALKKWGHNQAFINALIESKSVISGSFVLSAIELEAWCPNDLDIYGYRAPRGKPFTAIENHLWQLIKCDEDKYDYDNYDDLASFKVAVYSYQYGKAKQACQVMGTDTLPDQWIVDKYDLDFLKNTFDGKNVTIHCSTSLMTKMSPYRPHTHKRCRQIVVVNNFPVALHCHFTRMAKYKARGYAINNVNCKEVNTTDRSFIPLRIYYLDDKLWCVKIHKNHVVESLTFQRPNVNPFDKKGQLFVWRFNPNMIPYLPGNFDNENYLLLGDLSELIRRQISRTYHREENLFYQSELNKRFGTFHHFNNVY